MAIRLASLRVSNADVHTPLPTSSTAVFIAWATLSLPLVAEIKYRIGGPTVLGGRPYPYSVHCNCTNRKLRGAARLHLWRVCLEIDQRPLTKGIGLSFP